MTTPVTVETSVAQGDLSSCPGSYVCPAPKPDLLLGSLVTELRP